MEIGSATKRRRWRWIRKMGMIGFLLRDRPKKTREQERRGEERETWPLEKRRKKFEMRETVHVGFLLDFFFLILLKWI